MPKKARRPITVARIERRVSLARSEGVVYESLHDLLLDEEMEERGIPKEERVERRKRRVAVVGAGGDVGAGIVSGLAKDDFDVIAFVEKVEEAMEILDKITKALKDYKGTGFKIVADKLDDEDKATKLFSRVSQVVQIWEAKKAYSEARLASDYFERTLKPSLVLANACRRSRVDRIILASHEATPAEPLSADVLNVVHGGKALSEEAIAQSGVPCIKAMLPQEKAKGKPAATTAAGISAAVGMISRIMAHKNPVGAEVSLPKAALSKATNADALSRAFVLAAFSKAKKDGK
jgi:NAD(P)-dependent dehydrogenase (short-subunit alcohol dehydrogenase family)